MQVFSGQKVCVCVCVCEKERKSAILIFSCQLIESQKVNRFYLQGGEQQAIMYEYVI